MARMWMVRGEGGSLYDAFESAAWLPWVGINWLPTPNPVSGVSS